MVNYKQTDTITIGNVTIRIPKGVTIRHLTEQTNGGSGADAMYSNSAVYQVPANKKFRLLGITIWLGAAGGITFGLYEGATEDAITTLKRTIDSPFSGVIAAKSEEFLDVEIAGGKFITVNPGSEVTHITMVGYEY